MPQCLTVSSKHAKFVITELEMKWQVKKAMAENTKEGAQLAEAERAPLAQVIGEVSRPDLETSMRRN